MFRDAERVLVSAPHLVRWGAWTARTPDLQRAGWQLSAEHDSYDLGIRLAMRNDDEQLIAITNKVNAMDLIQQIARGGSSIRDHMLTFNVVRMMPMGRNFVSYTEKNQFSCFRPIDAKPQFIDLRMNAPLEDLVVFAPCMAETKELIVDESEVSAILAKLVEAQKPEQDRIRERNRLRESREGCELGSEPRRKFHAQILSITA